MTLQWRTRDNGQGLWSDWIDDEGTVTFTISIGQKGWLDGVEVREKLVFTPGFYRDRHDEWNIQHFEEEPPNNGRWTRVNVTNTEN